MPKSSKALTFKATFAHHRQSVQQRVQSFLNRRPHRSFRLTRRRDYARSLDLPGYWKFTREVHRTFWGYRTTLLGAAAVYFVLTVVLIGMGSQDTYNQLVTTLRETGANAFEGSWGALGEAGLLFASIATSGLTGTMTEAQQIYTGILLVVIWLTTVWLLRNLLAGHTVNLRDGLYNAGAPIVSTVLVGLVLIVQLLPIAIAAIGYSAAAASGLLNDGVEAMLFWIAALLLAILSLYWITSTFFALIIVTLPGMYPVRALRTAGDMVVGRRLRILLRIIWMMVLVALVYALILIPIILIDGGVKSLIPNIEWLPLVPVSLLALGAVSVVWSACYIYLLYRKVVEDDAQPA